MNAEVVLFTEKNREYFKPCIMPDVWEHIGDIDVFGCGVIEDNIAKGAIVCSHDNGIINILSLGVSPDCRRKGFARKLIKYLEELCSSNSFPEIQTRYFMEGDTLTAFERLLTSCNYSIEDGEFKQVIFKLGDLKNSRIEKQLQKTHESQTIKKLALFGELTTEQQKWLLNKVGIKWNERSRISPKHSCVNVQRGQIVGAALIAEDEGILEILQLYSVEGNETASMICLFATFGEAYVTMPPETIVRYHALEDIAESFKEKLLEGCHSNMVVERVAYRGVPAETM